MRARSKIAAETGEGDAPRTYVRTDHRFLAATQARTVAHANSVIINALRNGAMSARNGDTQGLTYADGWAAAATLAELIAFDDLKRS